MENYVREIKIYFNDGSKKLAYLEANDLSDENNDLYSILISFDSCSISVQSTESFFDALCKLRLEIEKNSGLLHCYGASKNVYPSPMQISMGNAVLAYRNYMGKQAYSLDIVNIFDSGTDVEPSTVCDQYNFHYKWLRSL